AGAFGYPHDELLVQSPGSASFRVLHGRAGYGVQQVPNAACPPGGEWWPGGLLVYAGVIYDYGRCVSSSTFAPQAGAVARFDARTYAYQGLTLLPGTEAWSSPVPGAGGWWITGTHRVPSVACDYFATDCAAGDVAWIPAGAQLAPARWRLYRDVIPAAANAGSVISAARSPAGAGYVAFTKQGDQWGGSLIEELAAPAMTGPWHLTGKTWPAAAPPGATTYSVQVHPFERMPAGTLLLTYAVNGGGQYWPDFLEVTP